jgi:hypothetical protein
MISASGLVCAMSRGLRSCRNGCSSACTVAARPEMTGEASLPLRGSLWRLTSGKALGSATRVASSYPFTSSLICGSVVGSDGCSASGPASTSSRALWRSSTVEYCIETMCLTWWLKLSRSSRPPRGYGEWSSAAMKRLRTWK